MSKKKNISEKKSKNFKFKPYLWQIVSSVLVLAVLVLGVILLTTSNDCDVNSLDNDTITITNPKIDQAKVNETVTFVKETFELPELSIKETVIDDGLYKITLLIEGQELPIYSTLSGNLIIPDERVILNKQEVLDQKEKEAQKEKELENISIADNYSINDKSNLEDFYGKPSVILFGGTYCGHCTAMVPEYKSKIWNEYNQTANIWVNVIDNKKFAVDGIAQGYNANLDYSSITGDNCEYVPSFIVLDKDGAVALKSCGSEKSVSDIVSKLDELLK